MSSVNKIILIGNVGIDPTVKVLDNGSKVVNFSIATSETFKKGEEKTQVTEWHTCKAWNALGTIAESFLKKGAKVYVEGKMEYGSYTDKDGIDRKTAEVLVQEIVFLESKS